MAITDAWTAITTTQTDADSPLNETLMEALRGNVYHNYDWIGLSYTPANNHNHDGTNSALIKQGGLSTATSTVTTTSTSAVTLSFTNTNFAFSPRIWASAATTVATAGSGTTSTTAVLLIGLVSSNGLTVAAACLYVQASPPYRLGRIDDWGEFLYLHRRISDGAVISSTMAPDPVWVGASTTLAKDHPARIALCPHPFAGYWDKQLPAGEEIVLVDLRHLNETVRHQPARIRREALVARRSEFIDLGVAAADIKAAEDDATAAEAAELAAQDAAQTEHDALEDALPRILAQAPERIDRHVVDQGKPRPRWTRAQALDIVRSRQRVLRAHAGHISRIEAMKREAEAAGRCFLQDVNEGRVAAALATRELSKDDRDKLPNVPKFRDTVRVLRAAEV